MYTEVNQPVGSRMCYSELEMRGQTFRAWSTPGGVVPWSLQEVAAPGGIRSLAL